MGGDDVFAVVRRRIASADIAQTFDEGERRAVATQDEGEDTTAPVDGLYDHDITVFIAELEERVKSAIMSMYAVGPMLKGAKRAEERE